MLQPHQIDRDSDKWQFKGKPMTLGVDFDGTCVEADWPNGPFRTMPGCVESLNRLLELGHTIIIWTCRAYEQEQKYGKYAGLTAVELWLTHNKLDHPRVLLNSNTAESIERLGGDPRKIFAHVYIDDRNLGGFPGWAKTMEMLGI